MIKKKIKIPKKAKLITDGGFYRIIPNETFAPTIYFPLSRKVRFGSPETNEIDFNLTLNIEFYFEKVFGGYAQYRQTGVVNIVK